MTSFDAVTEEETVGVSPELDAFEKAAAGNFFGMRKDPVTDYQERYAAWKKAPWTGSIDAKLLNDPNLLKEI